VSSQARRPIVAKVFEQCRELVLPLVEALIMFGVRPYPETCYWPLRWTLLDRVDVSWNQRPAQLEIRDVSAVERPSRKM